MQWQFQAKCGEEWSDTAQFLEILVIIIIISFTITAQLTVSAWLDTNNTAFAGPDHQTL